MGEPFLEYRVTPDEVVRMSLREGRGEPVEEGVAWRLPSMFRGQRSKPGWQFVSSVGGLRSFESRAEAWTLLDLDFRGTAVAVLPQPCRFTFGRSSAPLRHVPDFLVRHMDGHRELIDVKGAAAAQRPRFEALWSVTEACCRELGWAFSVASEPSPAYFRNVTFLGSVRSRRVGEVVDPWLDFLMGGTDERDEVSWADCEAIVRAAGCPDALASRVVARGVWTRLFSADLSVPLSGASVLARSAVFGAVAGVGR